GPTPAAVSPPLLRAGRRRRIVSSQPSGRLRMRLSRRTLFPAALPLSPAACPSAPAPAEPRAIVTVLRQTLGVTVVPAGSVTWIEFTVPIRIDNTGPASLRFIGCASGLEVRVGDQWSDVC